MQQPALNSLQQFDQDLLKQQNKDCFLVGVDEAGRGPLAGPVVAAAVILPPDFFHPEINDSKKLSASKREKIVAEIKDLVCFSAVAVSASTIDEINILQATWQAMRQATENVLRAHNRLASPLVAVDGWAIKDFAYPQQSCIQGDKKSLSIAAASLFAKVTRDELMMQLHETYPQYAFNQHKGYGTVLHLERLKKHGPCPEHRRSFAPVSKVSPQ